MLRPYLKGLESRTSMIHIKTKEDIEIMRVGGKILADILKKLSEAVKPGITTQDLEKLARELTKEAQVKPAFLGYRGYPAALCASVNDEVVHCEPSERKLKEGELVSLDMGILYKGFYLDSAVTLPVLAPLENAPVLPDWSDTSSEFSAVGIAYAQWTKLNPRLHKLLEATKEALDAGVKEAKVGNRVGHISYAIQKIVESRGFSVVRELVGHGIGRELHEEPQIPNFGKRSDGIELQEGMVLAIEPMVTTGDWRVKKDPRGFAYRTADGSYAAHFEHTVAVTKGGPRVLTVES